MGLKATRTLKPQGPPEGIYDTRYTPELADAICRRLAAGESLRSICRADPAMPTVKTVWNWTRQRADFAHVYEQALRAARGRRRAEAGAAVLTRAAAKAAAREAKGWRPTPAWPDTYSEAVAAIICDRLVEGEALYRICRDRGLPSIGTVYNWLKRHPDFARAYLDARGACFDMMAEQARETSPWLGDFAASSRELKRRERAVRRRRGQLWPRGFAGPPMARELEIKAGPVGPDGVQTVEVAWADDYDILKDPELWRF